MEEFEVFAIVVLLLVACEVAACAALAVLLARVVVRKARGRRTSAERVRGFEVTVRADVAGPAPEPPLAAWHLQPVVATCEAASDIGRATAERVNL